MLKAGDRRAYTYTSEDMAEIWRREHPPEPDFIEEDYPIEEETRE